MTYQQDPNRPTRRPRDYIRRDDGSWSPVALLLGVILLVLIGWLLLANRTTGPSTSTTQTNTDTSGQTNRGGSTTAPK